MNQISEKHGYLSGSPYLTATLQPLDPLPYPVYFVNKNPKWQDLIDNPDFLNDPEAFPVESLYARCDHTNDIWSAQTYIDLKRCGLDVRLADSPVPGQICFIPYYFLQPKDWLYKSYVVACYHDSPRPALCNQRVVLNRSKAGGKVNHFMPHRPQPNLKPRNQARGETLQKLVFKGEAYNLFEPFRTPEFLAELNAMDIQLVMFTGETPNAFENWANFETADAVLAVRNSTKYDISLKPAIKLINAWMAGCPALLSPEPSYQRLRRSSLDYIEVCTPEEAIAALRHLKENPKLYLAMIENGFRRACEFTPDLSTLRWRNLLAGPIAEGYEQWLKPSPLQKQVVRPLQYFWQIMAHKQAQKQYVHGIEYGPRILTDRDPDHKLQLPTPDDAASLGQAFVAEEMAP
jgi:hypothetical protein